MVKDIFFSEGKYISLPFFAKRVTLNVSSPEIINQSLKLYNPSSEKAKFVRLIFSKFIFSSNILTMLLSKSYREGKFIKYLEHILGEKFHSSLYFPTLSDKLVLQLLNANGNIFGYVKIGINEYGNHKVLNEERGIAVMTYRKFVDTDYLIYSDDYNGNRFIIVKSIEGQSISRLSNNEIDEILERLKKEDEYKLERHPGYLKLIEKSKLLHQDLILEMLLEFKNTSKAMYKLVVEHGDFAPWNMFRTTEEKIALFDFEYFSGEGIEHMDKYNYYYQKGKLLFRLKPKALFGYLKENIQLKEFEIMLKVFLINKILQQLEENSNQKHEIELLKVLSDHKDELI